VLDSCGGDFNLYHSRNKQLKLDNFTSKALKHNNSKSVVKDKSKLVSLVPNDVAVPVNNNSGLSLNNSQKLKNAKELQWLSTIGTSVKRTHFSQTISAITEQSQFAEGTAKTFMEEFETFAKSSLQGNEFVPMRFWNWSS